MASATQKLLCDATIRNSLITTVFEGEHLFLFRKPILSCVARQALLHVPLTNNDHKHTDTGHSLPDFYLQDTCKFAIQSAAWLTTFATRATKKNAKVLKHFFLRRGAPAARI